MYINIINVGCICVRGLNVKNSVWEGFWNGIVVVRNS